MGTADFVQSVDDESPSIIRPDCSDSSLNQQFRGTEFTVVGFEVAEKLPINVLTGRNLVRFCRHLSHEQLHDSFAANFGFRDALSRFSVLKNFGTAPGPDDCFSHLQVDARPMFEKLLGLEMEFPGSPYPLQPYSSMNYYRSHIEEVFHHTAPQHRISPPLRGRCTMFFPANDVFRMEFTIQNRSAGVVATKIRWFSVPCPAAKAVITPINGGFHFLGTQNVGRERAVEFLVTGASFSEREHRIETDWEEVMFGPHAEHSWCFEVRFEGAESAPQSESVSSVSARLEESLVSLEKLPEDAVQHRNLALKAAGILLTARYLERTLDGSKLPTFHGGKCGVAATWFWDTATSLLGVGLLGESVNGWGAVELLCKGIAEDGKPFVNYSDGQYQPGAQNPILAWGVWNFHQLCPNLEKLALAYASLSRYVNWWTRTCDVTGSGLFTYPEGCGTGLDDGLQWQENFPIKLERGELWHSRDWGRSRPSRFESVDVNTQLVLEMRSLGAMAECLGHQEEALSWAARADDLAQKINDLLFNPAAGVYQARSVEDGRFNEIVSLESFLPLYAGITPRPLAREIGLRFLLDPKRFYTTLPFCTLDASHEAFRSGGSLYQPEGWPGSWVQQSYWTGRTWLNYSFWMLGALHHAGLESEASEAAEKILDAVGHRESFYECYDPLTGTGIGHPEFPWAAASTLAIIFGLYKNPAVPAVKTPADRKPALAFAE